MPLFKCKMCGGSLNIESGKTVVECEYCGTKQTLPKLDDDKRANMYDRANHFRRDNEFDKAMGIYEHILNEDNTDAEAYWSLVLCRYGIEYVEDPTSHKRVPTVNRTQFTSVFDDDNYKSALQYADEYQRHIYEEEAKTINEIQKGILAISQNEEPFDVFICYKESDNNGRRTHDSVLAQELYYQLKQEGFKVFFSRITLEDKLGTAYEPYIFAALNSAKVMVVLGTKPEYFNAVWVKNEWSRYLSLTKQGQKKMLIPAYRDMDPYDLPEEFSHLQAQDMSKLGFMQDLVRGIKKIARVDTPKTTVVKETVIEKTEKANVAPLLKRLHFFLEDEEWFEASEYAEKVLDNDPECAEAYVGKLMAGLHVKKQDELKNNPEPFDDNPNYKKALRFANEELKSVLVGYIDYIKERNEEKRLNAVYTKAKKDIYEARMASTCQNVAGVFESISKYKDSASLAKACYEKAESMRKDDILSRGKSEMSIDVISNYQSAIRIFQTIPGWKNADELISVCQNNIEQLKIQEEERRRRAKEAIIEAEKRKKKVQKIAIISATALLTIVLFIIILTCRIIPNSKYNKATDAIANENYYDAYYMLDDLGDYKDSQDLKKLCANKEASEILRDIPVGRWSSFITEYEVEELIVPNTETAIRNSTFHACNSLKTVVIPDGVTNIGSHAFV